MNRHYPLYQNFKYKISNFSFISAKNKPNTLTKNSDHQIASDNCRKVIPAKKRKFPLIGLVTNFLSVDGNLLLF